MIWILDFQKSTIQMYIIKVHTIYRSPMDLRYVLHQLLTENYPVVSKKYQIGLFGYPLCSKVLMLNPRVGEIVETSSPENFFKIVVLPALSKPLEIKFSQNQIPEQKSI